MRAIQTFAQLNRAFGVLYRGISASCKKCTDPECMGNIWLFPKEARRLYNRGVSLIQVNEGPTFIHANPGQSGWEQVGVTHPKCPLRCANGRCSIHNIRPFICRIYPIGPETLPNGQAVWAIHNDCLYIRRLRESGGIFLFEERARYLIGKMSKALSEKIIRTYREVYKLTYFPKGENNYSVLMQF